jgi:hypothetical protein
MGWIFPKVHYSGSSDPEIAMDIVKLGRNGRLALPIEMYTSERIAEFERESEVDADTRAAARKAVDTANG